MTLLNEIIQQAQVDSGAGAAALLTVLYAFVIAVLVFRANPKHLQNRCYAGLVIISAVELVCYTLAVTYRAGLVYGRISLLSAAMFEFVGLLWYDAIIWQHSRWTDRIRRCIPLGIVIVAIAALPMTRWYAPWTPRGAHVHPGYFFYYPTYGLYLMAGVMFARAVWAYRTARPTQRIELLAFLVNWCCIFARLGSKFFMNHHRVIAWWPMFNVGAYTAMAVLMVGGEITTPFELGRWALMQASSIIPVCAATGALLWITEGTSPGPRIAIVGLGLWFAVKGADWLAVSFASAWRSIPQERARKRVVSASRSEWSESKLFMEFAAVIREYLGVEYAEVASFRHWPHQFASRDRNKLVLAAGETGRFCAITAQKRKAPDDAVVLIDALDREELSLILVHRSGDGGLVLFVGERATIQIVTAKAESFLRELLTHLEAGQKRIEYAMKAFHQERLATLGVLAAETAHKIRNCFEGIKGAIQMLQEHREAYFDDQHRALLVQAVEELGNEMNSLLDHARSGNSRHGSFDLAETVKATLATFMPYARSHGVTVAVDGIDGRVAAVYGDERAVRQVLINLLRNAAEALAQTDTKVIIVALTIKDRFVDLAIEDSGPGVPKEMHDELFTPFQTSKPNGTGIGLSSARDAMAANGGTIRYDRGPGEPNARFVVTLPHPQKTSPNAKNGAGEHDIIDQSQTARSAEAVD